MEKQYNPAVGTFVWAKLHGYPMWPAKVYTKFCISHYNKKVTKIKQDQYCVSFIGSDSGKFAWLTSVKLKAFTEQNASEKLAQMHSTDRHYAELRKAIQKTMPLYHEEIVNTDLNEDVCYICKQGGLLILCDGYIFFLVLFIVHTVAPMQYIWNVLV